MHSVMDMIFHGLTERAADVLFNNIQAEALVLENLLSDYDPLAETYILNKKAHHQWMPVSDRLWEILAECRNYFDVTKGYFDIGSGWCKNPHPGIPGLSATGIRLLETDENKRLVRFSAPEIALDFGGIGKGLLLREADKLLTQHGVTTCFISFGGSSILTRGHHPHGDHWPVTHRSSSDMIPVFQMKDDFASFSEGTPGGKNATAHIVNPYTKHAEGKFRVSGVQAGCPVIAEVVSTVLILATPGEAMTMSTGFGLKRAFILGRDEYNQPVKDFYYES